MINGQRDILRFEEWRYLATLPEIDLTVVRNVGHDANVDASAAYNRVLIRALGELSSQGIRGLANVH
jgi:hypothetical protein